MILAFAGGVGGAKLADGLYAALPAGQLTVVVNTADDFVLHGLSISPDLDTVMYTLAGLANPATGWGVVDDSFQGLEMLGRLGAPDWFRLGDKDLATHILRTSLLDQGMRLTQISANFCTALSLGVQLLPMCDERVATVIETPDGPLAFQEYFVQRGCRDTVTGVRLEGIERAHISPELALAIEGADAFVFCPSNPFVSIGPILAVPGVRERLRERGVPLIAVSPIIAGQALKGPAARMLEQLGLESSVTGVARLYADLEPHLFIDQSDRDLADTVREAGATPVVAPIIMHKPADRLTLASRILEYIDSVKAPTASNYQFRSPTQRTEFGSGGGAP